MGARAPEGRRNARLIGTALYTPATAWVSVQRRPANEVRVRFLRADPPLEHDTARARDRQAVAVRLRLCRIRRHPVVRAMVADELLKVSAQSHARRFHSAPRASS